MNLRHRSIFRVCLSVMVTFTPTILMAQAGVGAARGVISTDAGIGWAASSVNTVPFRRDPLVTGKGWQFIAYYDTLGHVVLGRRRNGKGAFELRRTAFRGKARDAHNVISIALDGKGHLHMAWDHHSGVLHYARSRSPLSLELDVIESMVGSLEARVTYPEFYHMPGGDLLFLYRNGASGNGTLVLDRYDAAAGKWRRMHDNLIDGEGKRNAYWQMAVDPKGTIHLSWVWRETPDVASNHDLCYARSVDGGTGWQRSDGSAYHMPIDAASAEYAMRIPQGSDLINQTSMCADAGGIPYIATYWRDAGDSVPQYRIVYHGANGWRSVTPFLRKTPFTLSGGGSRRIPISRPQVLASTKGGKTRLIMIYRDATSGSLPAVVMTPDILRGNWSGFDFSDKSVGSWEPSYDAASWQRKGILSLFVQRTEQVNGETGSGTPGQMVQVLDWKPQWKKIPNLK